MDSISGIYEIRNILNGNKYVGSSINTSKRWREHRMALNKNKHWNRHLQSSWNKYGEFIFVFFVIEQCNKELLFQREQFYIDTIHPKYNIAPIAGSNLGVKHTPKAIMNMSNAHKGKSLSLQARKKLSIYGMGNKHGLGYKHTQEARIKIGNAQEGKIRSEETRAKMSAAKKGIIFTQEHRDKISQTRIGRPCTLETRTKMSLARIGKKHSQESIIKMSESQKTRHKKRREDNG